MAHRWLFFGLHSEESPSSTRSNNGNATSKVISLKHLRLRLLINTGSFDMWRARKDDLVPILVTPAVNARHDSQIMRNDAETHSSTQLKSYPPAKSFNCLVSTEHCPDDLGCRFVYMAPSERSQCKTAMPRPRSTDFFSPSQEVSIG